MTNIVVIGGGFGGLQVALHLAKKFEGRKDVGLMLVDKHDYHLFTPNLYEVATSEEELTSVQQMKESITLPFKAALAGKNVKFLQGEVKEIFPNEKKLALGGRQVTYDYLVLALGSRSDFFNIEGAEKFALTLKSLPDALRLRNRLDFMVEAATFGPLRPNLRVVVAGGGYTGLELAGELKGLMDFLAWKYQYPREKIEIEVIEASNKLIANFDPRLSADVYERLSELGIQVHVSSRISGVNQHFVELMGGERLAYDCLIWTTGVRPNEMQCEINEQLTLDTKGKLCVNEFLQVQNHHNIFALGDMACVTDLKGKPVPASAQDAWDQAKYVAYALPYIVRNQKPPRPYVPKTHGFIVSLGGKWAIADLGKIYLRGFFGYVLNQLSHLRYYASIVGWWKAAGYVLFQVEMYSRND